ncbi:MAG: hypothetical protein HKN49_05550 [Gammaproteobacteria bacterium]|nr:hypothetical protein [Gammaproteobacteria bacterium]
MKLIDRQDTRGLRQFGLLLAVMLPLIFFAVLPWLFGHERPFWPLYAAAILAVIATLLPRLLYPVYRAWMFVARILGFVTNTAILGTAFVLIIIPMGLLLRLTGKLQYTRGFDSSLDSYRVETQRRMTAKDLENPF